MKSWLKGGLWGSGFGVVFYFMIPFGIANIFIGTVVQTALFFIFSPLCMLLENTWVVGGPAYTGVCMVYFGLPFNIFFYGVFGVIIGLIVGKIKP